MILTPGRPKLTSCRATWIVFLDYTSGFYWLAVSSHQKSRSFYWNVYKLLKHYHLVKYAESVSNHPSPLQCELLASDSCYLGKIQHLSYNNRVATGCHDYHVYAAGLPKRRSNKTFVCFSKEDLRAGAGWSAVKTGNMFTAPQKVLKIHYSWLVNLLGKPVCVSRNI